MYSIFIIYNYICSLVAKENLANEISKCLKILWPSLIVFAWPCFCVQFKTWNFKEEITHFFLRSDTNKRNFANTLCNIKPSLFVFKNLNFVCLQIEKNQLFRKLSINVLFTCSLGTERKLNLHKTFQRYHGHFLKFLYVLNICYVSQIMWPFLKLGMQESNWNKFFVLTHVWSISV